MENQHRQIKGYRELAQEDVDLMNEAKQLGAKVGDLIARIQCKVQNDHDCIRRSAFPAETHDADLARLSDAMRSIALGKTNIQQGFMWLIRGVAQPTSFV